MGQAASSTSPTPGLPSFLPGDKVRFATVQNDNSEQQYEGIANTSQINSNVIAPTQQNRVPSPSSFQSIYPNPYTTAYMPEFQQRQQQNQRHSQPQSNTSQSQKDNQYESVYPQIRFPDNNDTLLANYMGIRSREYRNRVAQLRVNDQIYTVQAAHHDTANERWLITLEGYPDKQYEASTLVLVPNEESNRRRIEYSLVQSYARRCKEQQTLPLDNVLDLYSQHVKHGQAVVLLDLSGSKIENEDIDPLCQLLGNGSLIRKLDLSKNKIGPMGCKYLSDHIINNNILRELDLSHNPLTSKSVIDLCRIIQKNRFLTLLNVAGTNISSQGCTDILRALLENKESSLIKLDLRYDGVMDEQIALLLQIAKQRKSLCFVETYPPHDENRTVKIETPPRENVKSVDSGWLSYDGWVNYSHLRELLQNNIEYMREHPLSLQSKRRPSVHEPPTDIIVK